MHNFDQVLIVDLTEQFNTIEHFPCSQIPVWGKFHFGEAIETAFTST